MPLSSVADLRAAATLGADWAFTPNVQSGGSILKFAIADLIPAASGASGEAPTSLGPFSALPGEGLVTRVQSDLRGSRAWHALFDLLWVGPSIATTATGTTVIDSIPFPARDVDGSSDGRGLVLAVTGIGVTTATIAYTNSRGVPGRTSGNPGQASHIVNIVPMPLQAGDEGVRSIQSLTVTTAGATSMWPLVLRPIGRYVAGPRAVGDPAPTVLSRLAAGTVLVNAIQASGNAGAPSYVRADIALG